MRAVRLHAVDGPQALRVENDVQTPEPQAGEVRVAVRAAALNRRDLYITQGLYPGIALPVILGSDGCGTVDAAGAGVTHVQQGMRVVINPMLHWGSDEHAWDAGTSTILGMPHPGTLAQYVVVPAENIAAAVSSLDDAQNAALPLAGLTAYRALVVRGELRDGETVLLPGIGGGVQTFALLFAKALGARVIVTSGSDEKLKRARALGADACFNYKAQPDWYKTVRRDMPVDLAVDSSGGDTLQHALEALKTGGRAVVYGGTRPQSTLRLFSIFWKHVDIRGTSMGSPADFTAMLKLVSDAAIVPAVDAVYPMDDIVAAVERLDRSDQFGKVGVSISA